MNKTNIEWATTTWNPITGCSPVSEGCDNCYAKRMSKRLAGRFGYPVDDPFRPTLHLDRFAEIAEAGDGTKRFRKQKRIFVCSMGDLFHEDIPYDDIKEVLDVAWISNFDRSTIRRSPPPHTFLFLTKRPERMKAILDLYSRDDEAFNRFPDAWFFGVTVENQKRADERIPILLSIPVRRFVSIEPMLGPIVFDSWMDHCSGCESEYPDGEPDCRGHERIGIDWVILGGENGPGARPIHHDWVYGVRNQCQASDVPFFFKGWGEWQPVRSAYGSSEVIERIYPLGNNERWINSAGGNGFLDRRAWRMARVGKTESGRLFQGKEYSEVPW